MTALPKKVPSGHGLALIALRPAGRHQLELKLDGRVGRVFERDDVAALADTLERVTADDALRLINAVLPGFSAGELAAFGHAVRQFQRHVLADAEQDRLRTWPDTIRVPL